MYPLKHKKVRRDSFKSLLCSLSVISFVAYKAGDSVLWHESSEEQDELSFDVLLYSLWVEHHNQGSHLSSPAATFNTTGMYKWRNNSQVKKRKREGLMSFLFHVLPSEKISVSSHCIIFFFLLRTTKKKLEMEIS